MCSARSKNGQLRPRGRIQCYTSGTGRPGRAGHRKWHSIYSQRQRDGLFAVEHNAYDNNNFRNPCMLHVYFCRRSDQLYYSTKGRKRSAECFFDDPFRQIPCSGWSESSQSSLRHSARDAQVTHILSIDLKFSIDPHQIHAHQVTKLCDSISTSSLKGIHCFNVNTQNVNASQLNYANVLRVFDESPKSLKRTTKEHNV